MLSVLLIALISVASVYGNCDGEVLTCEECTALTEGVGKCDWCPTDGRCHGNFDVFTGGCEAGWKGSCDPPPEPECDGETHRSCEECTALSERFTNCDYCAADGRCHSDTDITSSCESGWQDTCEPPKETNCDGEVIGCGKCLQKSEGFFLGLECKWCTSDQRCHGTKDFFPSCDGEWIKVGEEDSCPSETPDEPTEPDNSNEFPCKQCANGCVPDCTLKRFDNQDYCARGGTGLLANSVETCFANADSNDCCATPSSNTGGTGGTGSSNNGNTGNGNANNGNTNNGNTNNGNTNNGGVVNNGGQTGPNGQVADSDLVSMCVCGEGSCEGECVRHRVGECEPFTTLCDKMPTGFVRVAGDSQAYEATFHGASDCSDPPTARLSNACGSCNNNLRMAFQCGSASSLVASSALALMALFVNLM